VNRKSQFFDMSAATAAALSAAWLESRALPPTFPMHDALGRPHRAAAARCERGFSHERGGRRGGFDAGCRCQASATSRHNLCAVPNAIRYTYKNDGDLPKFGKAFPYCPSRAPIVSSDSGFGNPQKASYQEWTLIIVFLGCQLA
jgi:hypothetical protein